MFSKESETSVLDQAVVEAKQTVLPDNIDDHIDDQIVFQTNINDRLAPITLARRSTCTQKHANSRTTERLRREGHLSVGR